ncbi:iron-sulfur cluster assembly scaffold protein [Rubrobacter aplysinae]|uniref:iron-sulfur cluster assembly scaffold protein n=1 Tax=Rubrobacter aplysinae TaxID=909625 RepID=UPI00064BBA14|nr:iron-sulfur cluster assembly scaffold protein [Rubrobacter aplysinae]
MSTSDRKERVAKLVEHAGSDAYRGELEDADVAQPGGSPECGGSVTVYLKGEGEGVEALSFTGEGDTISMGSASILMQRVHEEGLGMQEILDLDYEEFVDGIGREVVGSRTRNATLGLSTLKNAVKRYRRETNAEASRMSGAACS